MRRLPVDAVLLLAIAIIAWAIAFTVLWATQWHAHAFSIVESDLPALTLVVWDAVAWGAPLVAAVACTAMAVYALARPGASALSATVWLFCLVVTLALAAVVGMTLPMVTLCGSIWPSAAGACAG